MDDKACTEPVLVSNDHGSGGQSRPPSLESLEFVSVIRRAAVLFSLLSRWRLFVCFKGLLLDMSFSKFLLLIGVLLPLDLPF